MTSTAARAVRFGGREYPVVLPTIRDPRLHLAAVIISIHVLGQVALGFDVSVAQILAAILTCAVIELVWTARTTGRLVWPASALLTGSGVALIFRVLGTENGDYWSLRGWYLFALVAGGSLVSKYVIKYRGSHVFNPSNLGLVVAFILLGSSRVEPLDFWWAPFGFWMAAAYVIILTGGLFITRRVRMLALAAGFWVTLAAGMGVLVSSGHCITARWAFEPVCGGHFWWVIVTSPEVLVFLFFMITDPKTVPAGRVARIAFGAAVAVACTLLIAPQQNEFGAKVALLGGLVVLTAFRPLFDRLLPEPGSESDRPGRFAGRVLTGGGPGSGLGQTLVRSTLVVAAVGFLAVIVAAAGTPARDPARDVGGEVPPAEVAFEVDPATLPAVTVAPDAVELDRELDGPKSQRLAESLAAALGTEAQALALGDRSLLAAVDTGSRLAVMEARFDEAAATGLTVVPSYTFDSLHVVVAFPYGGQGGAAPGIEARGTLEEVTLDADGREVSRATSPFAATFAFAEVADGRWLIVNSVQLES